MLSAPRMSTEEEAHFEVLRNFKVLDLEQLLSKETLCSAGLNRLLKGEFKVLHLSLLHSFFLLS